MNWFEKIFIGICVALIIFYIYLFITYGGKPVSECPTWVYFFLHGK